MELLTLKLVVTETFNGYLMANHYKVVTSNNPLTRILSNVKLDPSGQRWASALARSPS